jgi:hypothetical protein
LQSVFFFTHSIYFFFQKYLSLYLKIFLRQLHRLTLDIKSKRAKALPSLILGYIEAVRWMAVASVGLFFQAPDARDTSCLLLKTKTNLRCGL